MSRNKSMADTISTSDVLKEDVNAQKRARLEAEPKAEPRADPHSSSNNSSNSNNNTTTSNNTNSSTTTSTTSTTSTTVTPSMADTYEAVSSSTADGTKYTFQLNTTQDGQAVSKALTIQEVLTLLADSKQQAFGRQFLSILQAHAGRGYFWECVPFSKSTMTEPFEMEIIDTDGFHHVSVDLYAFQAHFERTATVGVDHVSTETSERALRSSVLHFVNLGRDAILVVPRPLLDVDESVYTHAATFFQPSSRWQAQQLETLRRAAELALTSDYPIVCLSTSGLGVSYLHIRVDKRPKYYESHAFRLKFTQLQTALEPTLEQN